MTDSTAAPDKTPGELLTTIAEIHDEVAEETGTASTTEEPHDSEAVSDLAHLAAIMPQDD